MPLPLRPLARLSALVAVAALSACASEDGLSLREPGTGGATPYPVAETTTTASLPDGVFALSSPAFASGQEIPARFTLRDGENISPSLVWGGVPADAVELAVVVTDLSVDGGFVHWVVGGIDPTMTSLAEGFLPPGVWQATNGFDFVGWGGPSPPGDSVHTYQIALHALFARTTLSDGVDAATAIAEINELTLSVALFTATYT